MGPSNHTLYKDRQDRHAGYPKIQKMITITICKCVRERKRERERVIAAVLRALAAKHGAHGRQARKLRCQPHLQHLPSSVLHYHRHF